MDIFEADTHSPGADKNSGVLALFYQQTSLFLFRGCLKKHPEVAVAWGDTKAYLA